MSCPNPRDPECTGPAGYPTEPCPFAIEIYGAEEEEALCDCCEACRQNCRDDI
jgi:hypothetical protein